MMFETPIAPAREGADADDPDQGADAEEQALDLLELLLEVEVPEGAAVVGRHLVALAQQRQHLLLDHRGRHAVGFEVTANQSTWLPQLNACWKVENGTKIVCASRSASPPDWREPKMPTTLK